VEVYPRGHEGRYPWGGPQAVVQALVDATGLTFIGHKNAIDWLKWPNLVLGGVPPLSFLDTELGVLQVENALGRIGYGGVS
jgi:uncharacterized protein (DUF2384 family)